MERWQPVSVLSNIRRGEVAGVRIGGHEVVLWREDAPAATLHAWEDRCPHRGMRLSFGFVRDDALGCLYHGWQFGGAARCRLIPAHPRVRVPASIHVRTYTVREHAGLAWVSMEGAEDFPHQQADWPEHAQPVRTVHVHAPVGQVRHAVGLAPDGGMAWHGQVGLAVHEPVAGQAMLHVVRAEDGPSALTLSHWAERLRDAVEGGAQTAPVMAELAAGATA
ncbi:vanillate O-demethylase oxygenase subunit [Komagataeibacter xylinus NBRC 13693]|uniref:Vanillate O-demethylase oxygenase subunit n=1 Tax=Komagataeibacter xylinus NBRC 13693 TaxID=1234668 RepID=A0A0D6Q693_KOMXY|nr:Rieske 2Fe-2S domain-containing protein [Komagataeibacter xylinus]GAN99077.1 vanillate O-demethylase oxygenase subunit [Komagataeibacter xylinus NBRC 13693]